ncbi:hypothetical protein LMB24_04835, partial [Limosilactobacillus reuteri]|nr:hypothetical protein [Limosilactobacillus reuteri]MCC4378969.1 hypothetical protein [Limosilactobacillus reuteri]MCC4407598.1 hypothetical protein [Limosilactobacillus reuteri]MCC4415759.1 hypothetical protein [Limosilactobacillus reuteri]
LPRDITAPSTNNQLVSIIYLSPVANLFLKFRNLKFNQLQHIKIKTTNLNSQNKIAKLLIKIEELKNNESNYYHNLMILKKYLLQKLFI